MEGRVEQKTAMLFHASTDEWVPGFAKALLIAKNIQPILVDIDEPSFVFGVTNGAVERGTNEDAYKFISDGYVDGVYLSERVASELPMFVQRLTGCMKWLHDKNPLFATSPVVVAELSSGQVQQEDSWQSIADQLVGTAK